MSTLLLLLLFVAAWVVLILPKQRELKRHNALVASLGVGDEVMSGSGIYGTITEIDGDVVLLEIAPGIEIRVARRAVAAKVDQSSASAGLIEADEVDDADADELVDGDATLPGSPAAADEAHERNEGDWPTDGANGRG
jgi:preprotein translocase subunit YajC